MNTTKKTPNTLLDNLKKSAPASLLALGLLIGPSQAFGQQTGGEAPPVPPVEQGLDKPAQTAPPQDAAPAAQQPAEQPQPAAAPAAQQNEATAPDEGADGDGGPNTINIVKTVTIYKFEGREVAADHYEVAKGDSLDKILKARGLITKGKVDAETMRLVKILNPEIKDFNNLPVGTPLELPVGDKKPSDDSSQPLSTEMSPKVIKEFDLPVSGRQKSSTIKVIRHVQIDGEGNEIALIDGDEGEDIDIDDELTATSGPAQDYAALRDASDNEGEVAQADDGTVYRTVKIRKGDTLEKLLRREGLNRDLIYSDFMKITKELNPDLKNPNLIIAGAEIRIPTHGNYMEAKSLGDDGRQLAKKKTKKGKKETAKTQVKGKKGKKGEKTLTDKTVTVSAQTAKQGLEMVFNRLGENISSRGVVLLPLPSGQQLELDTALFPVVELSNGRRLVIDWESKLSTKFIDELRTNYNQYMVFRPAKNESLIKAMERLWPMCGYYRVYKKGEAYEGGTQVKLSIEADWIIWPTREAWNLGQPLVINQSQALNVGTPPAWNKFLSGHGFKIIDIYQNQILPEIVNPAAAEAAPHQTVTIPKDGPALAYELAKAMGIKVRMENGDQAAPAEGVVVASNKTIVAWEDGAQKIALEFGEAPLDKITAIKKQGYKVITCPTDAESVVRTVLYGLDLKTTDSLAIDGTVKGGPKMSLAITGKHFIFQDRHYLITEADLPPNLTSLDPKLKLTVFKN